MHLSDFQIIRPPFQTKQEDLFRWLIEAHRLSDGAEIEERLRNVGCKPEFIGSRGHILPDYLHRDWSKMEIFRIQEYPKGMGLDSRIASYAKYVDRIFEEFYEGQEKAPDDLIHVTCTGYVAPSGAQKIVSKKSWDTTVTHAYHMGCYGSIPALRMARGFLKDRVDIVHTEVCSIHANPSKHASDQLVCQSLFADGFIKYSMNKSEEKDHFRIESIREEIIPDSRESMTWNVAEWGFEMMLAKEVPVLIARRLKGFLERLGASIENSLFAVHPGGPKILHHVRDILNLRSDQMKHSFQILEQFGNMSSATLPHIWKAMLEEVPDRTPIVSLAFGPGLSICGSKMEKRCGGQP